MFSVYQYKVVYNFYPITLISISFPCGSAGKESACNAGDLGLIPGLGRSLSKGKATPSSILAWRIPWTVPSMGLQSRTRLSVFHFQFTNQLRLNKNLLQLQTFRRQHLLN